MQTTNKEYLIRKVRSNPDNSGLRYKEYGKSDNISDYSDIEIGEMLAGIYKEKRMLLVDGDYFINMEDVNSVVCKLESATYFRKPTLSDYRTNDHNYIKNIRTFYVRDYLLVTRVGEQIAEHRITKFLVKVKAINPGRGQFSGLYSVSNRYQTVQAFKHGKFPKDLFHPIKFYINEPFFSDQYHISDFAVDGPIRIETS